MDEKLAQEALKVAAAKKYRSLVRHRERYVSAWMAKTGFNPEDAQLTTRNNGDGSITIIVNQRRFADSVVQRDEKIALLSQQVLSLRRDLSIERRRTRREKPDEERWWDAFLAALRMVPSGNAHGIAGDAERIADEALMTYHRRRDCLPSEAPTPVPSDAPSAGDGGDADGPEGGDPA